MLIFLVKFKYWFIHLTIMTYHLFTYKIILHYIKNDLSDQKNDENDFKIKVNEISKNKDEFI